MLMYISYFSSFNFKILHISENGHWFLHALCLNYTLLKSDVIRRDHVSIVMDPMNAGSRIVNFIVNFIRDGTNFAFITLKYTTLVHMRSGYA